MNKLIFALITFLCASCGWMAPKPTSFGKGVVTSNTGWVPGTYVTRKEFGCVVDTSGDGTGDIWCIGPVYDSIPAGEEVDVIFYKDVQPEAYRRAKPLR